MEEEGEVEEEGEEGEAVEGVRGEGEEVVRLAIGRGWTMLRGRGPPQQLLPQ